MSCVGGVRILPCYIEGAKAKEIINKQHRMEVLVNCGSLSSATLERFVDNRCDIHAENHTKFVNKDTYTL